ncbi:hypothetical protein [Micromonospora inyonensis]|uniref:Uncharacterized protein n=1 Tax=Micromonospora inyonensis TaxID=47866 RepID=A0A1C6SPH2_9ACTN|nr:hypothetical protein [Micromonospora inyonensis]SCL31095.1 hypothetical protein GA0074694_5882 [Micromonospora inyonensis]
MKILLSEAAPENLEMIRRAVVEAMAKELLSRPSSTIAFAVHLRYYLQSASSKRLGFWMSCRSGSARSRLR